MLAVVMLGAHPQMPWIFSRGSLLRYHVEISDVFHCCCAAAGPKMFSLMRKLKGPDGAQMSQHPDVHTDMYR